MKIIFAGTPEIAAHQLRALLEHTPYRVVGVYTQPDRPAGRGQHLEESPVKKLALAHQIPVFQPLSLKSPEAQSQLAALQADLMIVVAYGLLLPKSILDTPRFGCWNLHVSALPRWRGAAPIARAIEAGDTSTAVTVMQMDEGLDTGPILLQTQVHVAPNETAESLEQHLAKTGATLLIECLHRWNQAPWQPTTQSTEGITYAKKLTKQEAQLDFTGSALDLERKIRAYQPWPIAYGYLGEHRMKFYTACVIDPLANSSIHPPGALLSAHPEGLDIQCGTGILRLQEVQLDNGKRMPVQALIQGRLKPQDLTGQYFRRPLADSSSRGSSAISPSSNAPSSTSLSSPSTSSSPDASSPTER